MLQSLHNISTTPATEVDQVANDLSELTTSTVATDTSEIANESIPKAPGDNNYVRRRVGP